MTLINGIAKQLKIWKKISTSALNKWLGTIKNNPPPLIKK